MSRWTARMDAVVIEHRGQLSSAQIGDMLGVSRCAVIGRARRLGLEKIEPREGAKLHPQATRGPRFKRKPSVDRHVEWNAAPMLEPKKIPLLDLEVNSCRWPVEGEGHLTLFCGHDKEKGHSYCAAHCSMAYERPGTPRPHFKWVARKKNYAKVKLVALDAA